MGKRKRGTSGPVSLATERKRRKRRRLNAVNPHPHAPIELFPMHELHQWILCQLEPEALVALACSSRTMRKLVYGTRGLWERRCEKELGLRNLDDLNIRYWFQYYCKKWHQCCAVCGIVTHCRHPIHESVHAHLNCICSRVPSYNVWSIYGRHLSIEFLSFSPYRKVLRFRERQIELWSSRVTFSCPFDDTGVWSRVFSSPVTSDPDGNHMVTNMRSSKCGRWFLIADLEKVKAAMIDDVLRKRPDFLTDDEWETLLSQ